ncbi:hypothetical protein HDV00_005196 [Rhizophlyctis rosea]|nr:hypothetical protein HDV00_005196 [Rhizophlyctis rosea]
MVDLTKLTVPLLKAKCRELGLTVGGTKAVLISRIQEHLGAASSPTSEAPAGLSTKPATSEQTTKKRKQSAPGGGSTKKKKGAGAVGTVETRAELTIGFPSAAGRVASAAETTRRNEQTVVDKANVTEYPDTGRVQAQRKQPPPSSNAALLKPKEHTNSSLTPQHASRTTSSEKSNNIGVPGLSPPRKGWLPLVQKSVLNDGVDSNKQSSTGNTATGIQKISLPTPPKRTHKAFKKLFVPPQSLTPQAKSSEHVLRLSRSTLTQYPEEGGPVLQDLGALASLGAIVRVVIGKQGHHVKALSVVLGSTDAGSLGACERLSRRWGMAAHAAWALLLKRFATHCHSTLETANISNRHFPGPRTTDFLTLISSQHPPRSCKPYYKLRHLENTQNLSDLRTSWIGRLFAQISPHPPTHAFSDHVMKNHEDMRQLEIARRWWGMMFFRRSGGVRVKGICEGMGTVVDVKILADDFAVVWSTCEEVCDGGVTRKEMSSLVVCATGETVGSVDGFRVPEEWEKFAGLLSGNGTGNLTGVENLIAKVPTISDDHPHNIHFKIRPGSTDYTIAARYILAHAEGWPVPSGTFRGKFMLNHPIASAVQSVHLSYPSSAGSKQMHPELAFVQTFASGGVWVLRELGVSVGTEDWGVNGLWREVLGCGAGGEVVDSGGGVGMEMEGAGGERGGYWGDVDFEEVVMG